MKAYKFLSAGRIGLFSDFRWPRPGEWVEANSPIVDCLAGIHAVQFDQLLDWIDDELWEVELGGEIVEREEMLVAQRGRLVGRVEKWNEASAHAFADACATRSGGFAAQALRRAGLDDAAARIDGATELAGVQAAAVAALKETNDEAVGEVVAFAADMVSLVAGQRPDQWGFPVPSEASAQSAGAIAANAAFVAAHAAGRAAVGASSDGDAYGAGFAAEREWQLARLGEIVR